MDLNKGIFGKGLSPEEAKKKESNAYEKATGRKVGSGTKKIKSGHIFSLALLFFSL